MTEFEKVLDECLRELENGAATVDDCLDRNPAQAAQLKPILLTVDYLHHGREARPSAAVKARVRARLKHGMQARPRRSMPFGFLLLRPAVTLAVLALVLLASGTAYAQQALPGEALYPWKVVSENVWRTFSPDPVGTDIALARRRAEELIATAHDPGKYVQALQAYLEVRARLEAAMDSENAVRIRAALEAQAEQLEEAGAFVPVPIPDVLPVTDVPTPTATSAPDLSTPQVGLTTPAVTLPPVSATRVPALTDVPGLPPTGPTLPKLVPTIEIPPPIP